jgi:hypothetical protein
MHHEALQKTILLIQDTELAAECELPNAERRRIFRHGNTEKKKVRIELLALRASVVNVMRYTLRAGTGDGG